MRLPEFLTKLSPVRETLEAMAVGEIELSAATENANRQLHVTTADSSLSQWEADCGLPDRTGESDEMRRAYILAAMAGDETMTPAQLATLAITVGGADGGTVEEDFAQWQTTLYAEGEGRLPTNTDFLQETVSGLKPSHLDITVIPRGNFQGHSPLYTALHGSCLMELYGSTENLLNA